MDWDKGSLINEGVWERNKWCKWSDSAAAEGCPVSPQATATLGKKLPPFYCRVWHYMIWNIILVSLGQLSCWIPSQPLGHPQPTYGWGAKWENTRPWICTTTTQQNTKHWCVTTTVLVTNSKPSTVQGTVEKTPCQPAMVWHLKNILEVLVLPSPPKSCCSDMNLFLSFHPVSVYE